MSTDVAERTEALARAKRSFAAVFGDGTLSLGQLRQNLDDLMTEPQLADDVAVTEVTLGGVAGLKIAAGPIDDRVLVWLHGGGYVMGSPRGYCHAAAAVSRALGSTVIVPDYRLAPENPFPAALDDATAVVSAVIEEHGADKTALAGDSAGGGLTVAVLVNLRDRQLPLPSVAVAVSPLADFTASGASFVTNAATDPVIRPQSIPMLAASYLRKADRRTPLASPVFADLQGLPPMLLLASDSETLLDDAVALDAAVQGAGGVSTLSIHPETCHAWTLFTEFLPQARDGVEELAAFVRKHQP